MKSVLISIQPKWVEKIAKGKKTIVVRKTAPKCKEPFKCYIYETKGKVIGEFICDKVFLLHPYTYDGGNADRKRRKLIQTFEGSSKGNEILAATCLTQDEMFDYIGAGNYGYGWHISDLKIYDKPKELGEFIKYMDCKNTYDCCACHNWSRLDLKCIAMNNEVKRPPQSWCYVEEL